MLTHSSIELTQSASWTRPQSARTCQPRQSAATRIIVRWGVCCCGAGRSPTQHTYRNSILSIDL
eukprot:4666537-Prymnesium_polylepis.1